jgi:hypothetical protein
MSTPSFDDPRSFLQDFGVSTLSFRMQGGNGAVVNKGVDGLPLAGIFDEKYVDAKLGDYDMVAGGQPRLRCMSVDVSGLKKHDQATIEGIVYYLDHDPMPDGHGYSFLFVSKDTGEV